MKVKWSLILSVVFALVLVLSFSVPSFAATTADVTNTATPKFISISVDNSPKDWGAVATSATPFTTTSYFTVTNTSSIAIDVSIKVTGDPTGGAGWTWSDTATAGADTVGMTANAGGTWGVGDVIIKKSAAFNNIVSNQAATTNFSFGEKLYVPTSFTDGAQKTWTVRLTASEH